VDEDNGTGDSFFSVAFNGMLPFGTSAGSLAGQSDPVKRCCSEALPALPERLSLPVICRISGTCQTIYIRLGIINENRERIAHDWADSHSN